jgi:hypothetical protein
MTTNNLGVKRYELESGHDSMMRRVNRMKESEGGVYVRFDDYEALQAECEWLRETLRAVCRRIGRDAGKGGSAEMALETHSKHSTTSGKPRPYKIEQHEFGGLQVKIGETRKEQARFAEQDAKVFCELADELRSFQWCVDACGHDGQIHLDKAREIARDAIKRLVNYI